MNYVANGSKLTGMLSVDELIDRFTEDTNLLPHMVADRIAGELVDVLGSRADEAVLAYLHNPEFSNVLAEKTGHVYGSNDPFRELLKKLDDPRAQYDAYMRHWACAELLRTFPVLRSAIPARYSVGDPSAAFAGSALTDAARLPRPPVSLGAGLAP